MVFLSESQHFEAGMSWSSNVSTDTGNKRCDFPFKPHLDMIAQIKFQANLFHGHLTWGHHASQDLGRVGRVQGQKLVTARLSAVFECIPNDLCVILAIWPYSHELFRRAGLRVHRFCMHACVSIRMEARNHRCCAILSPIPGIHYCTFRARRRSPSNMQLLKPKKPIPLR